MDQVLFMTLQQTSAPVSGKTSEKLGKLLSQRKRFACLAQAAMTVCVRAVNRRVDAWESPTCGSLT
jgi:hypothetical protein